MPTQNIVLQNPSQLRQKGCVVRAVLPPNSSTPVSLRPVSVNNGNPVIQTVVQQALNPRVANPIRFPAQSRIVLSPGGNCPRGTLVNTMMKSPATMTAVPSGALRQPTPIKAVSLPTSVPQNVPSPAVKKQSFILTSTGELTLAPAQSKPTPPGKVGVNTSKKVSRAASSGPKGVSLLTGQPAFLAQPQPIPTKGLGNFAKVSYFCRI